MNNKYKVCIVSLRYPPYIGGAERQMSLLEKELKKNGIDVKVFSIKHPQRIRKDIVSAPLLFDRINFANKILWGIFLFFQLLKENMKNSVIYSFGHGFDKFAICLISLMKKVPYVIKLSGTVDKNYIKNIEQQKSNTFKHLQNKIILEADKIVVQDKLSIENLKNDFGINKDKINLIPNGVKAKEYKKIKKIKNILFVGRIIKEKGVFELCKAFVKLKKDFKDITLTIVGDGPESKFLSEFREINYVGKKNNIENYYKKSDLLILPTYFREGLPNVVLEAMSFGVPVVSTPVGSLIDIFTDNKDIFYVEKQNIIAIKEKIKYFYLHPEIAEKVSSLAYSKVKQNFSMDENCRKYMKLFREVIYE